MQYDIASLLRIAQSPQGQQFLSLLNKTGGTQLQHALAKASEGDYQQAKDIVSELLSTDELQRLVKALEDQL